MKLERIQGVPFVSYPQNVADFGPASRFDRYVTFELTFPASKLNDDRDQVAADLLRRIFFATNWADLAEDEDAIDQVIESGHEYNGFGRR